VRPVTVGLDVGYSWVVWLVAWRSFQINKVHNVCKSIFSWGLAIALV
jgi:hypothetical protein